MNPSTNGGPELQLPPLAPQYQAPTESFPGQAMPTPEQPAGFAEQALPNPGQNPLSAPVQAAIPMPVPLPPQPQAAAPTTNLAVPSVADDQDLIEKEWVSKAKQIIDKTHDDPYRQSQELTVFKSDYMQKRYNKTIKSSE